MKPLAIVAGAGAGLGQSLLTRFDAGGFTPVGLGRTKPDHTIGSFLEVDFADEAAVQQAMAEVIKEHGAPTVVIHNAAELVIQPFLDTQLSDFQRTWTSMVQSAVLLAQSTFPAMVE